MYESVFGNGNRLFYLIGNFVVAREECEAFFEVPLTALFYGMAAGF